MSLGAPELGIILLIVLVIFGGSKLPKLARSLGQAQKEFKQGLAEGEKNEPQSGTPVPGPTSNPGTDPSPN
ncbi:MAG: twin-arginine translocase TatA/TatE family subunit [Acidimicrobiia bacterium]|nr:twin-arginine translocase TatA/TatE family subunit [Acidimicrobiia bacterium]